MANSSESLGLQYHGRCISLPSRLQYPNPIRIESQLNKLNSFQSSSLSITHPLTPEVIQSGVIGLVELYDCAQELMGSPKTQTAIFRRVAEEGLERSVEVLDSCASIRDLCLIIKEHVQALQSALQRRKGDPSIESHIKAYLCLRKRVKKEAAKKLRILKQMEIGFCPPPALHTDHHLNDMFRVLRDVNSITIGVLRSILVFFSSQGSKVKRGGWSFIADLMLKKPEASEKGCFVGLVEGVDSALASILENLGSPNSKDHVQIARKRLEYFSCSIEGLENGLECLFRQLLSNRVTLLNILSH